MENGDGSPGVNDAFTVVLFTARYPHHLLSNEEHMCLRVVVAGGLTRLTRIVRTSQWFLGRRRTLRRPTASAASSFLRVLRIF